MLINSPLVASISSKSGATGHVGSVVGIGVDVGMGVGDGGVGVGGAVLWGNVWAGVGRGTGIGSVSTQPSDPMDINKITMIGIQILFTWMNEPSPYHVI